MARIRIAAWRSTYRGIVPASVLDRLDLDRTRRFFAHRIERSGRRTTLVAEAGGTPVAGYALAGPSRDDDAPGLGEIEAIYLDPVQRGRGIGRALLEAASGWLAEVGYGEAILWVLTDNADARRFYERLGFAEDGAARMLDFDGTAVEEVRYRRGIGRGTTIPA